MIEHAAGVAGFNYGERVEHRMYGQGTVIRPDRYTRGDMVRVRFVQAGIIRVLAASLWRDC